MQREIKDVAGVPNWMVPEVIELKDASTKSLIWSGRCTVIELLVGRSPYRDIGNAMDRWVGRNLVFCSAVADDNAVIFRIVDGECPPILGRSSGPLIALLKECFHENPEMRLSAENRFDHEWLKNYWGLNKVSPVRAIVTVSDFCKGLATPK